MNTIVKNNASVACEWVENLPEDWEFRLIKREFTVTLGKMLQSAQHTETETEEYYLRSANLRWEGVDITDIRRMWFAPHEKKKLALQYGDLLVSEGGDVGRTSFWKNELSNCYIQNAINRVRARKKDSTRFLYYWLHLIKSIGYIDAVVSRITIAHLTAEKLERIPFVKPPISFQHRIASYLDKTCAAIDKGIEAKQKQLETLDALRKSIITKAVTRGLDKKAKRKDSGHIWIGRIPREWKVEKLKYVADLIVDGTHFTPDYIEEGVPFLRVTDIQNSQIDQNKVKRISEEAHRELCKRANPKAGDILLSKNGTIGLIKVVEWNWEFSIFVSLCLIRLRKFLSPYFFRYYFESDVVDQQFFESSKRTSVTNLHLVKIREMRIAFPRLDEQQTIVAFLDTKCAELDKLKENIQQQISTLEQYRKSLIHESVTGKRRITEADMQGQL